MIDVVTMTDLWKEDVDGYLPVLLEIYNPDISWDNEEASAYGQENSYLRLIADINKVVYKGKTYLPCAFKFTAPELDGKKIGAASITMTAFDSRVKKVLRSIRLPSEIKIVSLFTKVEKENATGKFIYRFKEMQTSPFTMNAANSNQSTVSFTLLYNNNLLQNVPYDVATPDRVPGSKG